MADGREVLREEGRGGEGGEGRERVREIFEGGEIGETAFFSRGAHRSALFRR